MMRNSIISLSVLLVLKVFSWLSSFPSVAQSSPAFLQDITVRIDKSSNHPADIGGSGVLITSSGNNYTILTAYHVVQDDKQDYIIRIPSKTSSELFDSYVIPAKDYQKLIKRIGTIDLASISLRTAKIYKTATIDNQRTLNQNDTIFIAGYPQSKRREYLAMQAQYDYECAYKSEIYGSLKNAYCFNTLNTSSGMSGGPVVDKYGYIIGIFLGKSIDEKNSEAIASVAIPILNYPMWRTIDKPQISNLFSRTNPLTKDPPYVVDESNIITTNSFNDAVKYNPIDYSLLLIGNPVERLNNKPFTFWAVIRDKPENYGSRELRSKLSMVYLQANNRIFKRIASVEPDQMPYLKSLYENKIYLDLEEVSEGYSSESSLFKRNIYASINKAYLDRLFYLDSGDIVKIEAVLKREHWGPFIIFSHIEMHRLAKIGSVNDSRLLRRCKWINFLPRTMQDKFSGCRGAEEICTMWGSTISKDDFYFKSHCQ